MHWIDDEEKIYSGRYVVEDHFTKWVGDPIFKLSDIDGDIINFYAVWEEITYTANYICNHKGEQYKVKIGEKTYEEEFVLGECPFSFDGYEFSHYHLPYDRTDNQYKPGQTVKRLTYDDGAYVYIEAILVPKEYTIVFDKNGATSGEMLPMTATFDSNVTLPENKFVKEGYTFLGWEFNETLYLTNEIGLPISTYTESITLKARWVENLKGKGTIDNPYTISSIQDLNNFAEITKVNQFENEYVVLTEDIDCKFTKLKSVNFAGTFDGKGYKLINVDYENGCLFEENSGIIENLAIENLKIEIVSDDANKNLYIAGLVKSNIGFISRCYVKGDINIQTAGNVRVFGLVASNTPHDYVYGQTKFCFTELNVEIRSELSINTCAIYGFGRGGNFIDYNYSIFSLTANLKNVENLYVDALGFKGSHSFAKANVNVNVDSVTNYDFTQTAKYYSDDSTIKLLIGGKSVPNIIQTTTASSNLKDKDWMEENLFDVKGVWIYDSSNFPTPSYTFQNVIDRQDLFNLLKNNLLFGEYILNCDIDLSENINFIILKNYGVFNGNGHIIRNYSAQEVAYKNLYALFETNYGIIKNLGIENINIELNARQGIIEGAGLVCENYGIINSCFVKGSLSFSNIDGDTIVGGIVAVSKGGKVLNSYSDVSVYICNTSNVLTSCYAGGIVATGEGNVENCYSKQNVNVYAHYASGTFSAFGISGAEGKVKNSFVLSNVSVVEYSSNGDFQAEGIGNDYENSFAYEWQKITRLGEDLSFGDKSYEELCSTIFLESLNFKAFISQEDLVLNNFNVWVFSQTNLPKLWFEE